jgi:hypothetical protein
MIGKFAGAGALALVFCMLAAPIAAASTAYDGSWSLSIMTDRGACDSYNFPVRIANGNVSFPGIVHANGRVSHKGAVRVFVSASGKSAWGSGRLSRTAGAGRWTGRSGADRCSGRWSAQRG